MYPRIQIVSGLDSLLDSISSDDVIVFDNILELDPKGMNNVAIITDNYLRLYDMNVEMIFDRSPSCDSVVIRNYGEMYLHKNTDWIRKRKFLADLLEINISSYINYRDAAANIKRYSQLAANKKEGKSYGRPVGSKSESAKAKKAKQIILKESKDFNGILNDDECMRKTGVSRNMFYVYKRELKKGANNGKI